MKKLIFALLILALLTGCAGYRKVTTQEGIEGYKVSCNGKSKTWENCEKKAETVCNGNGYEIFDSEMYRKAGAPPIPAPQMRNVGGIYVAPSALEVFGVSMNNMSRRSKIIRNITVVCNDPIEPNEALRDFSARNEFFEIVRYDMADLFDLYAANGKTLSIQEAYDLAVSQNVSIQKILKKRQQTSG